MKVQARNVNTSTPWFCTGIFCVILYLPDGTLHTSILHSFLLLVRVTAIKVKTRNIINTSTPWHCNFSCAILHLSDSTSRTSNIFTYSFLLLCTGPKYNLHFYSLVLEFSLCFFKSIFKNNLKAANVNDSLHQRGSWVEIGLKIIALSNGSIC